MERVAVLHVDPAVRSTLKELVEARGLSVVEVDSVEALADAAESAPIALVMVDASSLQANGLEALQKAALGDRPLAHVPVILLAPRGARLGDEPIDELLWEPIEPRELWLRVESGLARRRTSELVAVASHELRSPVHAIVAFLDLLGRSELPTAQRDMVEGARTASRHLLDLVEDLLEHARLGQGPLSLDGDTMSIRDVVREATSIALEAARADHVPVTTSFADGLPDAFRGDGPRVRQILINLLSNALKFGVSAPVRVSVRRVAGMLEIEVADDGPGVPDAAKPFLFEPFRPVDASVTRRFGGTGLGLAIARTLARRMGGDVGVRDVPGSGASFVVTLALSTDAEAIEGAAPRPLALLADGDAIHRTMTAALLERLGYRVETVGEGVAAVMFVMEHRPALLVLDMALAALDGVEVARRLRGSDVAIPIVGFSREPSEALSAQAAAVGVAAVVGKPITPLLFQRALRQASAPSTNGPRKQTVETTPDDPSGERSRLAANRQMDEALRAMIAAVELHGHALDTAIAKQDLGLAAEVTRALRAAVITLNARGLEAVLRDLEQAARAGDVEECRRAHRSWHAALASLRENVERFLVRQARTS